MHGAGDGAQISARSSAGSRVEERRLGSSAELGAEMEKLKLEMRAEERGAADEFSAMSTDRLKEEILLLKQRIEKAEGARDWGAAHDLRRKWWRIGRELGERAGKEGLAWVNQTCPDALPGFMEGWARKEPHEVLGHIERSKDPMPCSKETLMNLLKRLGSDDPQALQAAVGRVPWELFVLGGDPFNTDDTGMRPGLAPTDDVKIWLGSGVARQMAEQGVYLNNLFSKWAAEDLPGAIAGWSEWPAQERKGWMYELETMLEDSSRSPEGLERLQGALSGLDENAAGKVREALGRLQEIQPGRAKKLNDKIPALKELLGNPAPPP